jgi:hypothetical protein
MKKQAIDGNHLNLAHGPTRAVFEPGKSAPDFPPQEVAPQFLSIMLRKRQLNFPRLKQSLKSITLLCFIGNHQLHALAQSTTTKARHVHLPKSAFNHFNFPRIGRCKFDSRATPFYIFALLFLAYILSPIFAWLKVLSAKASGRFKFLCVWGTANRALRICSQRLS